MLVNSRGLGSGDEREHFVETTHHGGSGGSQSLSWLTVYTSVPSAMLLQLCGSAIADCGLPAYTRWPAYELVCLRKDVSCDNVP